MTKQGAIYDELCLAVYNTNRYFHHLYQDVLGEYDLTYLQYLSILVTWQQNGSQLKDICQALDLSTNTLTPVIQKLVQKGWLLKQPSKTDKRVKELILVADKVADFQGLLERINIIQSKVVGRSQYDVGEIVRKQHELNALLQSLIAEEK